MDRQPDPIIAELRAIREEYAARFNYDVAAMFKDIRAKQKTSGQKYVRLPSRPPRATAQHQPTSGVAPEPGVNEDSCQ